MKKSQIVFINQSSGYLMIDIIGAYKGLYDERILLAGSVNSRNNKLPEGVVLHSLIKYVRDSKIKRIYTWIIAFIQILWIVKTRYRNAFLFIVTNPPLSVFIPLFCKNSFSLLIYDVYPDALTELKILKEKSFVVKLWKLANKIIYAKASRIVTISNGMKKLLSQYSIGSQISVIPIWTDNQFFLKIPKEKNTFLKEHGLYNKFIVLYSGNLGYTHDIDVIIDLADHLQNDNVYFLIIGSGEKYKKISLDIKNRKLQNCKILPLQPSDIMPYSFSAADIAIVTLSKDASRLSVPSKTYNYLSVGAPLLCIVENNSEIGNLVLTYNIGECFSKNEIQKMQDYILKVKNNIVYKSLLQNNAYKASLDFGVDNALKFIADV